MIICLFFCILVEMFCLILPDKSFDLCRDEDMSLEVLLLAEDNLQALKQVATSDQRCHHLTVFNPFTI